MYSVPADSIIVSLPWVISKFKSAFRATGFWFLFWLFFRFGEIEAKINIKFKDVIAENKSVTDTLIERVNEVFKPVGIFVYVAILGDHGKQYFLCFLF